MESILQGMIIGMCIAYIIDCIATYFIMKRDTKKFQRHIDEFMLRIKKSDDEFRQAYKAHIEKLERENAVYKERIEREAGLNKKTDDVKWKN